MGSVVNKSKIKMSGSGAFRRTLVKLAENRVGGGTPVSEIRLEEKRIALRRALKREYMKQSFEPENVMSGKRVFDAAFYRFNSIQNSSELLVRQNFRNFGLYCCYFIIPTYLLWKHYTKECEQNERDIRDGKIAINAMSRRHFWFLW